MIVKIKNIKIGVAGCGAIGSRIAAGIIKDFKYICTLSGIFDTDHSSLDLLSEKLSSPKLKKNSLKSLIKSSDLVVEAVTAENAYAVIKEVLSSKKNVLVMSVGQLLKSDSLFKLARKNNRSLLIPSGAIAGVDAIKAAGLVKFKRINLTTRKPPSGLENNPYLAKRGIDISKIKKETVVFEGGVNEAVRHFPKNINVAATIALACGQINKLKVRIITSPRFKNNSHEIEMVGAAGKIATVTENTVCSDNPKTSYLAVLSCLQMLKQFCSGISIGT